MLPELSFWQIVGLVFEGIFGAIGFIVTLVFVTFVLWNVWEDIQDRRKIHVNQRKYTQQLLIVRSRIDPLLDRIESNEQASKE